MLKREFKINFKSLIIWTSILAATYVLIFSIYPYILNDQTKQSLTQMMQSMPSQISSQFNMDIVGIEDAFGWFKTEGYVFLTLLGGLYAAILGSTILIKEESDKTIEFLYSKPISRNQIISAKIICGIINIFLFTAIITLVNYVCLSLSVNIDNKVFFMISLIPLLLYYMLFFITLFISTFMNKTKKSMSIGIAIVFIEYFLQIIGGMGENVKIIKDFSLFEFVSSRFIILNNKLDIKYIIIGLIIICISITGTYIKYNKKELL